MSKHLFELGKVTATVGAMALFKKQSVTPIQFLRRHVTGDFGDLCDEDKEANNEAIWNEGRIVSSYKIDNHKIWIITEGDRSSTCCLLPKEY